MVTVGPTEWVTYKLYDIPSSTDFWAIFAKFRRNMAKNWANLANPLSGLPTVQKGR